MSWSIVMRKSFFCALFVAVLSSPFAHSQAVPRMSSSEALVQDLDTAKSLGGLGKLLIEKDGRSKKWADYCGASLDFSNRGLFRDAVQQAARALSIGEQSNDPEALFFASRDLSYAYYLAGPRWPLQIPPPVATPNSPRQDARIMTARG
jgi:hypothetical protein